MWHGLEGVGWGWIALGIVHVAMFWALCIGVLIWMFSGRPPGGETAIDILKERLAKGELNLDEFERLKRELLPAEARR